MDGGSFTDDSHSQAAKSTDSTQKGNYLHYCWQSTTPPGGYERRAVFNQNHALKKSYTFAGSPTNSRFSRNVEKCQNAAECDLIDTKTNLWATSSSLCL